jgi:hypothetical protein
MPPKFPDAETQILFGPDITPEPQVYDGHDAYQARS